MNQMEVFKLLEKVAEGNISPHEAIQRLKFEPFEELDYANIDYHRGIRQGTKEVIYGLGKSAEQIIGIATLMVGRGAEDIIATRVSEEKMIKIKEQFKVQYEPLSQMCIINPCEKRLSRGSIVVISAGTSDMAVCEEAALTAEVLGNKVTRVYDVGVAGIHRLLSKLDILFNARVVVAVAGMEGALASVVGGLVDCPVVAVPTSVGYGANLGGISALLSMLNSCASGVSVVNIDNGFGAGYLASIINQMEGIQNENIIS